MREQGLKKEFSRKVLNQKFEVHATRYLLSR
jgi:hypothetical protein